MGQKSQYPVLYKIKRHYKAMITNRDLEMVCTAHILDTLDDDEVVELVGMYMGGMSRPEIMSPESPYRKNQKNVKTNKSNKSKR